jgi:integrase
MKKIAKQAIILDKPSFHAERIINSLDISENSRREYRYRIRLFLKFAKNNAWNVDTFRDFKRFLENKHEMSVFTKSKYLAVAKVFLRELARLGALPVDITINVKDFKRTRGHVKVGIAPEEVIAISKHLSAPTDNKESTRLKAMFYLFAHQGLRAIEVSRLDVSDINLAIGTALIQGKSRQGKELVYLEPTAVASLKSYINTAKVKSGPLFVSFGNRNNGRLSTTHIQRLFREVFRTLKIEKTVHGFRHFYATRLLESGIDIRDVQKFTRHADISTVTVYDDEQDIKEKAHQMFPIFKSLYAV